MENNHTLSGKFRVKRTQPHICPKDPLFGDWMVKRKRSLSKEDPKIEWNVQYIGPSPGFSKTQSQVHQRNNVCMPGRRVPVSVDNDVADEPALPVHPTIPTHCVVPVRLIRQKSDGGIPIQPAHQAIIRNPVVSVKRQPPHLRGKLPVNRD